MCDGAQKKREIPGTHAGREHAQRAAQSKVVRMMVPNVVRESLKLTGSSVPGGVMDPNRTLIRLSL